MNHSNDKVIISIFASGGGSNARKIVEYFQDSSKIEVGLIVTNRRNAGVLKLADEYHIPSILISKDLFYGDKESFAAVLANHEIKYIILAGFLWMVPSYLVELYSNKMLNIHPSLLPKYGGPGMYGHHVHEAVHNAKEQYSGMTIHLVNEHYDKGDILFQASTDISHCTSAEEIATEVLCLEHEHYAHIIEEYITKTEGIQ